jgi:positive regulator of sigma E activity
VSDLCWAGSGSLQRCQGSRHRDQIRKCATELATGKEVPARLADRLLMQASSCGYIIQAVCTVAGTYRLSYTTSGHDALTKENTHGKHAYRRTADDDG